jgi:hypothetical protein
VSRGELTGKAWQNAMLSLCGCLRRSRIAEWRVFESKWQGGEVTCHERRCKFSSGGRSFLSLIIEGGLKYVTSQRALVYFSIHTIYGDSQTPSILRSRSYLQGLPPALSQSLSLRPTVWTPKEKKRGPYRPLPNAAVSSLGAILGTAKCPIGPTYVAVHPIFFPLRQNKIMIYLKTPRQSKDPNECSRRMPITYRPVETGR